MSVGNSWHDDGKDAPAIDWDKAFHVVYRSPRGDSPSWRDWLTRSSGSAPALVSREDLISPAASSENALRGLMNQLTETERVEETRRILESRSDALGRPGTDGAGPLNAVRAQLETLYAERRAIGGTDSERNAVSDAAEAERLAKRKAELEEALRTLAHASLAQRIAEAERLSGIVAETTKQCFALSGAREFPLERAADFRKLEGRVLDLRSASEDARADLDEKAKRFERECQRISLAELSPIDESWDARIQAAESRTQKLRSQLESYESDLAASAERHANASRALENLPDFSRIAADPIEWLHTLANTFQVHRMALAQEREKCTRLKEELDEYAGRIAEPAKVFAGFTDIAERTRAYEVETRVAIERTDELRTRIHELTATADEHSANVPASVWMALLMFAGGGGLAAAYHYFPNAGLLVPGVLIVLGGGYFVTTGLVSRIAAGSARRQLELARDELTRISNATADRDVAMNALLEETGCESPRELEALHDSYRQDSDHHEALTEAHATQCRKTEDDERHVASLFTAIRESFRMVGVETESEDDVPQAVSRAVSRYQEYRDAKRRQAEGRDQVSAGNREIDDTRAAIESAIESEVELSMELRRLLRESGFRDENQHTSAASALRAFRIRFAQQKSSRGRMETLQETAALAQRRVEIAEQDRNQLEEELNRQLKSFDVTSIEEWHEAAEAAERYRDAWARRNEAQSELTNLLDGEELEYLRARLAAEEPTPNSERANAEANDIRSELDDVDAALARLSAASTQAESVASPRSPEEVEEEIAYLEGLRDRLTLDLEATAMAAARIDDAAEMALSRLVSGLSADASTRLQSALGEAGVRIELEGSGGPSITDRDPRPEDGPWAYLAVRAAIAQRTGEPLAIEAPWREEENAQEVLSAIQRCTEGVRVTVLCAQQDLAEAAGHLGIPVTEV